LVHHQGCLGLLVYATIFKNILYYNNTHYAEDILTHILTQHFFNDIVYYKHKHKAECIAKNDLTYQVLPLMISFINIGAKWWHKQAAQDTPDDGPMRARNM
jgi:hypothetical protein